MSDDQREAIERLERRVAVLENLVRRLAESRTAPEPIRPRVRPAAPTPPTPAAPSPATAEAPPPLASALPPRAAPSAPLDLEQWFGQRGLLIIGSVALLAAGAFFLKYAFDRGWIRPLVRSLLAIGAGIGIAAWGEQRIRHGMQRYGAAMIGAGSGLVFLGIWAAAGPYALIDRRAGVLLLAATTVVVTLLALRHALEPLALWALAGAYLAPISLPPPVPDYQAFLGYLEIVGLGTGFLAFALSWRRTFDLALFGYLLLAAAGAAPALHSPLGCWLVAAGAVLTLHVTRRRPWPEARLGVLILSWLMLGWSVSEIGKGEPNTWLALGAAAAVWGLLWWQQLEHDAFADAADVDTAGAVERMLFISNPIAFLLIAGVTSLGLLQDHRGLPAAILAVIYIGSGWLRRSAPFVLMGFALGGLAMALEWSAIDVVLGWTALTVAALAVERAGGRPGGGVASIVLAAGALVCLFTAALLSRDLSAPTFSDRWALALYVYVIVTALCARWWGSGADPLWALAAVAVFGGGSVELSRWFGQRSELAGDLALSVWWLVYAGALVLIGFQLNRKAVRSAGLAVAAGAGLKIVLYDLSTLQALYRVASFFALALITLAVAYAYNRKASQETVDKAAPHP